MHPLIRRISNTLESTRHDGDVPQAVLLDGDDCYYLLHARFPGPDDRALFYVDVDRDAVLHVALASDSDRCAPAPELAVDSIKTAPTTLSGWRPSYLAPTSWRTVRLPSERVVTLIDVPAGQDTPLADLLDDLRFLANNQHVLANQDDVCTFDSDNDPSAPFIGALDFGPAIVPEGVEAR